MTEELQTKSEFQVSVWADNHQATILNMGSGRMCLSGIADSNVKYEDREFFDEVTKEKKIYQARVSTKTVRLQNAFNPSSNNTVNCSCWFQEDLPFPGVNLAKLKPKVED